MPGSVGRILLKLIASPYQEPIKVLVKFHNVLSTGSCINCCLKLDMFIHILSASFFSTLYIIQSTHY